MKYSSTAPILRGVLRTGETGPVITATEKAASGKGLLKIDFSAVDNDVDRAALATEVLADYQSSGGAENPEIIEVAGEGVFRAEYPAEAGAAALSGQMPDQMADQRTGRIAGRMAGRVALVTGGAQGFGEEIVRHLVSQGARVFIADLNIEKASELSAELNETSGQVSAWAVKVDVSDEASVEDLVAEVVATAGGLDLFINNAGVLRAGSVKTLEKRDFDFVTSINYSAYFICVKHFSGMMALQNLADGRYYSDIVQINSKSGLQGSNKNGAYAGGKFGGIGLTQSFAMELVEDNIKVNSICPGNFFEGPLWSDPEKGLFVQYLNTGKVPGAKTVDDVKAFYEAKVPMGRGCRGEDVARAIYYVVEQKYETGQAIPVTGGQIMLN